MVLITSWAEPAFSLRTRNTGFGVHLSSLDKAALPSLSAAFDLCHVIVELNSFTLNTKTSRCEDE